MTAGGQLYITAPPRRFHQLAIIHLKLVIELFIYYHLQLLQDAERLINFFLSLGVLSHERFTKC